MLLPILDHLKIRGASSGSKNENVRSSMICQKTDLKYFFVVISSNDLIFSPFLISIYVMGMKRKSADMYIGNMFNIRSMASMR